MREVTICGEGEVSKGGKEGGGRGVGMKYLL